MGLTEAKDDRSCAFVNENKQNKPNRAFPQWRRCGSLRYFSQPNQEMDHEWIDCELRKRLQRSIRTRSKVYLYLFGKLKLQKLKLLILTYMVSNALEVLRVTFVSFHLCAKLSQISKSIFNYKPK